MIFTILKEHFALLVYFIAWVVSILNYRKYFDTTLRNLPIIIVYTFFNELLGTFIRFNESFAFYSEQTDTNQIIYNVYIVIFFFFFFFVYRRTITRQIFKKIILRAGIITLLAYVVNSFFQSPITHDLIYANVIGSISLLLCCILYFIDLNPPFQWKRDKYNLMIWVSLGLFLFYLFFPYLLIIGYLRFDIWQQYDLRTVLRILIVLMYSLFCIGFIISRRRAFR